MKVDGEYRCQAPKGQKMYYENICTTYLLILKYVLLKAVRKKRVKRPVHTMDENYYDNNKDIKIVLKIFLKKKKSIVHTTTTMITAQTNI